MKNLHLRFSAIILPLFFSFCRADYQVYVQNLSKKEVDLEVFTIPSGSAKKHVAAQGKEWIKLGKKCISYILLTFDGDTIRWDYPPSSNSCRDLSVEITKNPQENSFISRVTYDLEFKGPAITGYKITPQKSAPTSASKKDQPPPKTSIPPAVTAQSSAPSEKGPFQVYVENNTSLPITTQVYLDKGMESKTTKVADKDWIHLKNHCIDYIIIKTSNAIMRFDFKNNQKQCTNLSVSVIEAEQVGKLTLDKATFGLEFQGDPVAEYKISYPEFTPEKKEDYEVYVLNKAHIDLDVHIHTKSGQQICKIVGRNDREWIHLQTECIDYITIRTVINEGTFLLPKNFTAKCTNLSLEIDIDDEGRPIITQSTDDSSRSKKGNELTGTPLNGWRIKYEIPLF